MELHLHLSAAFRALDRKWGSPVDLDTTAAFIPFDPAIVDRATETFSSEHYLKSIKRPHGPEPTQCSGDDSIDIKIPLIPFDPDVLDRETETFSSVQHLRSIKRPEVSGQTLHPGTDSIDIRTPFIPCHRAVLDSKMETFSSEQYLRSIKKYDPRQTPYSRDDQRRRKTNLKRCDSFANISIPIMSPEDGVCSDLNKSAVIKNDTDLAGEQDKEERDIIKQLKRSARSFIQKKILKKGVTAA